MAGVADRAIRSAMRKGLKQGLLEGHKAWLSVGVAALGVRLAQRLTRRGDPVIVREALAPGETLVIRHLPPPD